MMKRIGELKAELDRIKLKSECQAEGIDAFDKKLREAEAENARLKAEVERLTELNATLSLRYDATNSMLDGCAKEIEEMEAQVERLTKAGDELGEWFMDIHPSKKKWHAAKEGGQP
jgi:archaellum component FlaC